MNTFRGRISSRSKSVIWQRNQLKKVFLRISECLIEEINSVIDEELRPKRLWVRKWNARRTTRGASALLLKELPTEDPHEYRLCLRLTPENFEDLCNLVSPVIQRSDTMLRDAMPARVKLEVTLNFLATGNSYSALQRLFRVPKSTISKFVPEVCDAIYDKLREYIKVPSTSKEWEDIGCGFQERWNFPKCCGAIDGKHILIQTPSKCGTQFFNYKGQNSVVLMALSDYDYCFTYIDVRCNGIVLDGDVFQNCSLSAALEEGLLPQGYCIVGDNAFPLKTYLIKPYNTLPLSKEEKIFNYRLSRARRIVENAFGILISRYRIFEKKIACNLSTVDKIVKACCALHNWLRKTAARTYFLPGSVDEENVDTGDIIPGRWRSEVSEMRSLQSSSCDRSGRLARGFRDYIKQYVNNEGAVSLQDSKIH